MSLPSYRQDQPIRFQKKGVRIVQDDGQFIALFSLFSDGGYKKAHPGVDRPRFRIKVCDNTQKAIVERIVSGEYVLGLCQLAYERPKWFLSATYEFEPEKKVLDNSKILGVDLGCVNAIYASSYGQHGYFKIPGDEISAFEIKQATMQNRKPMSTLNRVEKLEEDRYAKQLQARYCGDGRIGHGIKTRVAPAYAVSDKIARFRDTINHRYSRALVDYAVKNGYGTIQMEDLSGIKDNTDFPKRLRHWTYFDLQTKIKYKAEENGIKVIKVNPEFTSQRCSRCGCIDERNRTTQSDFKCIACGAKMNADYNASQNLSIMDIDKLIKSSKATTANAKLTCESN
jgi:IS605 OrfB family transposase